ncbi:MAG: hypothetical protein HFI29_03505 [Lachnospiraceae bacterium]|jgi:leader peptidase (prepilin peptidase)/N-methyltransferase|nr:hypothetical protein [Lachnospiraceae bacterium]
MEEMIIKGSVLALLLINGLLDLKKGEVSLLSLGGFALLGAGLNLALGFQRPWELAGGIAIGLALLILAFLTGEAIGFGDGLLLGVTGIYLGFWENLRLLALGTLCCALIQGIGVALRKVRLKDRVPLVPFLLLAFAGGLML